MGAPTTAPITSTLSNLFALNGAQPGLNYSMNAPMFQQGQSAPVAGNGSMAVSPPAQPTPPPQMPRIW